MVVVLGVVVLAAADFLQWEVWFSGVGIGGGGLPLDLGVIADAHGI